MSTPTISSCADQLCALDDVEPDPAEPEHDDVRARLDLGGLDHRADPGRDAAADVAAGLERRVLADLGDRDLGQDGEVREGRAAHVVEDRLALVREADGAVRHHALALGRSDLGAKVGLARKARLTFAAFGRVQRDHVIARLHAGHARPDLAHHARALVAEDRREDAFAVEAVERVGVGVADARRHDLDQHFALPSGRRDRPRRSRAAAWRQRRRRRGSSSSSPNCPPPDFRGRGTSVAWWRGLASRQRPLHRLRRSPSPANAGEEIQEPYAVRKRLIQPPTRALSLGAPSEAMAASGSGTIS